MKPAVNALAAGLILLAQSNVTSPSVSGQVEESDASGPEVTGFALDRNSIELTDTTEQVNVFITATDASPIDYFSGKLTSATDQSLSVCVT